MLVITPLPREFAGRRSIAGSPRIHKEPCVAGWRASVGRHRHTAATEFLLQAGSERCEQDESTACCWDPGEGQVPEVALLICLDPMVARTNPTDCAGIMEPQLPGGCVAAQAETLSFCSSRKRSASALSSPTSGRRPLLSHNSWQGEGREACCEGRSNVSSAVVRCRPRFPLTSAALPATGRGL